MSPHARSASPAPAATLTAVLLALGGCAVSNHPTQGAVLAPPSASSWEEVLARPGVLEHEAVVSARWHVPLEGLVNLDHPAAKEAGLEDREIDIVLPVHVLKHPERGVFVIDTGVPKELVARGLVTFFLDGIETVEPLGSILERQHAEVGGVLITHFHPDHVLGLPEVPKDAPVFVGPGELEAESLQNAATRSTYDALLEGRAPLRSWRFEEGQKMGPIASAIDVLGDGSLWALSTPGHTPGSTAYLAVTTSGPILFTGDTSHTLWGWEHGVEPGSYTADQPRNAESLKALKDLVAAHPEIKVFVGHETDGVGTGVEG